MLKCYRNVQLNIIELYWHRLDDHFLSLSLSLSLNRWPQLKTSMCIITISSNGDILFLCWQQLYKVYYSEIVLDSQTTFGSVRAHNSPSGSVYRWGRWSLTSKRQFIGLQTLSTYFSFHCHTHFNILILDIFTNSTKKALRWQYIKATVRMLPTYHMQYK